MLWTRNIMFQEDRAYGLADKRIKLYIEAGLALLLVLTLALAGASGILSASADDSGREKERIKAGLRAGGGRKKPDGRGRNNRRRAVSDHGRESGDSSGDGGLF